jgi:hypothetical protein
MAEYRWRRIEPGYYTLQRRARDTGYEIANMQGQSVRWSGLIVEPWVVRGPGGQITAVRTKAAAQAYVMALIHENA